MRNEKMTDLPRFETLLLERRGRALHVTLNRPETKNAISRDMVRDLAALAGLMEQDRATSAIVMRGANGTFCAGGDIKGFMAMFKSAPPRAGEKDSVAVGNREFGSFMTRFEALPQAIVMVVEGAAFGGGLGLLCAGDVVLATADAKFAMSETGLGIPPAQIAPFVAARVGIARTRRLALTGYRFDGREAERIGLVDVAYADAPALEAGLVRVLAEIARCAPGANAAIKRLLLASRTMPRDQLLDESADAFAACLRGPEGQEGVTAFLEKRKPNWVG
jgi:isohexenylglutaconyl-CoA hydratase